MTDNKCYRIVCKTGCMEDSHYRGWYETKESAQARIDRFLAGIDYPVASQYARRGRYHIEECIFEPISKNRIIVDSNKLIASAGISFPKRISKELNGDTNIWSKVPSSFSLAIDKDVKSIATTIVIEPNKLGIIHQKLSKFGL